VDIVLNRLLNRLTGGVDRLRAALAGSALVMTAAVTLVLFGPVPMASAHAGLIASDPADGATLNAPVPTVSLTFSDPIDARFVKVAVTVPAGAVPASASAVTTSGPTVSIVIPGTAPGAYRVVYRVVSADGHPVSGTLSYAVAGSPASPPGTAGRAVLAPAATVPGLSPHSSGGGTSTAVLAAGAGVAAAVGAAGFALTRRRREPPR
jgi:methionine-rich copper-binding protein CopC